VQNKINHFLPEGIIFVSVNYRLSPQVGVLDEAADVARAWDYVQAYQTGLDHGSIDTTLGLSNPLTDEVDSFLCSLGVGCGGAGAGSAARPATTSPRVPCSLRKDSPRPCPKR
jgi:hypothetical protein